MIIDIGVTHDLTPRSAAHEFGAGFPDRNATEAVKRLVEAHEELYRAVCDFVGTDHVPRGLSKVLGRSRAALAPFTESADDQG